MATVTALIAKEKYRTRLTTSTNELVADEPVELGGTDLGFSPAELLKASLASCTAITLRMYADRSNWEVHQVRVTVDYIRDVANGMTQFDRKIVIEGELDPKQMNRMLAIANACPMHKLLMGQIKIETKLIGP